MPDLFERIKTTVGIQGWVESDLGSRARKEGDTLRVNPCPFCSHNECFTLYPADNSFHCFSAACDRSGSLIDYVMLRQGITEPLEAAKLIAEKMGIPMDPPTGKGPRPSPAAGDPGSPAAGPKKNPPPAPAIAPERAAEIRRMAAEFYHGELLGTPEALAYQTEHRRHSIEILSSLQVGYASSRSLIKYAVKERAAETTDELGAVRATVEELMAVGLVQKGAKGGYRATIPKGAYVYPHLVDGQVVYFTIKRSKEEKPFQIKKAFAAYGWLCFNQEALLCKRSIIVEGENDLISVLHKGQEPHCAATIGNFNTSNILSYLKQSSRDHEYYLCFDNDPPDPKTGKRAGEEYAKKYSAAILEGGGRVWVIRLPDGVKDIDDYLRSVPDPERAFRDLMTSAEEVTAPATPEAGSTESPPPGNLFQFDSFSVLGEMEDGRLVFQANDIQKIHIVTLRDLTMEKLIQVGGLEVRRRVSRNDKEMEEGQVHLYALRKHLVLEARKSQLGPLRWVGQGVSSLDDGRILIVNGSEAYTWDGKKLEIYSEAIIEGKIISRRAASRWIDAAVLQKHLEAVNADRARAAILELRDLVAQWGFEGKYDVELVTGFILAQIVESVWAWRPHLWLTGKQGCGKTLLLSLVEEIGGSLAKHFEGSATSEPGFRQGIGKDYVLAAIDEFERSEDRERIISYLRTAGRGGYVVKGSPGQEVVEYYLRHMVLVASIETGLVRAAEKSRFLVAELKKDDRRNPHMPLSHELEALRNRLFAAAIWAAPACRRLIDRMERIKGYDPRLTEAYAVPFSMLSIVEKDATFHLYTNVGLAMEDHRKRQDETPEDEESILDAILNSTIRISVEGEDADHPVYTERSVLWLLRSNSPIHKSDAQAHGVWTLQDGAIFFSTDIIQRKLLKDTRWKEHNITGILKRIPGMEICRVKREGKLIRGLKYSDHDLINPQEPSNVNERSLF